MLFDNLIAALFMPFAVALRWSCLSLLFFAVHGTNAAAITTPTTTSNGFIAVALPEAEASLAAPQGVTARASLVRAIALSWQPVVGAVSYTIEKSENGAEGSFATLKTVPADVNYYRDTNLDLNQKVYYRLKATANGIDSPYGPVVSATTNADDIVRIMPLGDSNTEGGAASVSEDKRIGYRMELYKQLVYDGRVEGYKVDLVGSEQMGQGFRNDFLAENGFDLDVDHAGFGGFRNEDLVPIIKQGYAFRWFDGKRYGLDHEENYLQHFSPNIILLHSGTNNISNDGVDNSQYTVDALEAVLNEVDSYEESSGREVTVILAKIIKSVCKEGDCYKGAEASKNDVIDLYNAKMQNLALNRIRNGDRLVLVDMQDANLIYDYTYLGGDMADRLHPAQSGYDKMAEVWLSALRSPVVPLPVELIEFNALLSQNDVLLKWSTASEQDNNRFEVERMQEGKPFTVVATLAGAGTSSRLLNYTYRDAGAPAGQLYYRLKQVDDDGTYSYSKIVAVSRAAPTEFTAKVYPNPTDDAAAIYLSATGFVEDAPVRISLMDAMGRKLHHETVRTDILGSLNIEMQLPASLSKGLHILELTSFGRSQKLKLLVR